ncbi:MAG: NfeD family protein [Kiritimatiellae bacterium]|jgi:membrane-bound serine protease (ClpP class)|nr:NfeD family protein [Kiritimatiellia bacterium]MDD4118109.1 NfeD family protein [Kiritimatiellia bacterium]
MEISPWTWYAGLLIGGLMLIIAEVFIPGGIAGVFGAVALLAAMGLGLAIFPPPWGLFSAVAMVVFGGIFILLWVQVFPRTRAGRRIALRLDGADYKSSAPPPPELRGATGEAVTALRPAGIALIQGKRYDVLAEGGEWIAAGAAVRVSEIRNGHLIVSDAGSP